MPSSARELPFDDHYPNAFGEVIIVSFAFRNNLQLAAGLTQFQFIAAKGFYDVVRYSEEDVYITRDQFDLFCSTLPFMEQQNLFLNFLRFEFNSSEVDAVPNGGGFDVLHAYAPEKYWKRFTVIITICRRR